MKLLRIFIRMVSLVEVYDFAVFSRCWSGGKGCIVVRRWLGDDVLLVSRCYGAVVDNCTRAF